MVENHFSREGFLSLADVATGAKSYVIEKVLSGWMDPALQTMQHYFSVLGWSSDGPR